MINSSNFFLNNFFELENSPCECKKETVYTAPGVDPSYVLKVCAKPDSDTLRFSYSAQKGLNQSGNAGRVINENILGQLLAIKPTDMDGTIEFLQKYGFIFPVSSDTYETVDGIALLEILNRIKATVKLMSAIAGKKDYKAIFIYTTYLLYSEPVELVLSGANYKTDFHPFTALIREYNVIPDLNRNQEFFDTQCISIFDTMKGDYEKLDINELAGMNSGDGINGLAGSRDWHFRNLFCLYTTYNIADENLRNIIDFYYNYQKKVGIIKDVEPTKISYYVKAMKENFSDDMKEMLVKIARIVISEEINANLKNICPQLEINALAPTWKLNSLLEALYFSVFYMKPGVELYKECENPNCKHEKYFLINATVTNKKYCCPACGNAAAQRRSRQRKLGK
nr:MAG TPA: zinc finger protein [Bacteriophage sp.]